MGKLLINIKSIYGIANDPIVKRGKEMDTTKSIHNAWLLTEGERISDFGEMKNVPENGIHEIIDLKGKTLLPTFCDSHTHLVFAAPRDKEFDDRIKGLSYEEIAKRGGGILNSVKMLRKMSENDLFDAARERLKRVIEMGTGAIEIKSGYGLDIESELKMLRVIKRLKNLNWIPVKSTFLGAHAIPEELHGRKNDYIKLVSEEMLPAIAKENLADYIDIFCESGYFDLDDTKLILERGMKFGLRGKIHVNQFNILGGVEAGVNHNALSVDHLEHLEENDIRSLQKGNTIATLLPSCSFFLGIPYAPANQLIDSGISVALASDFNPGSTPGGNMSFVWSLACIKMKMTIEKAFNALTINGAAAMELEKLTGSITKGHLANFIITMDIPSLSYIPYTFSDSAIHKVMINGKWFQGN